MKKKLRLKFENSRNSNFIKKNQLFKIRYKQTKKSKLILSKSIRSKIENHLKT